MMRIAIYAYATGNSNTFGTIDFVRFQESCNGLFHVLRSRVVLSFKPFFYNKKGCADEGITPPNIVKIARKLIKIQPCCKRNGHGIFRELFLSVTVVGQMDKVPPPQWRVLRLISDVKKFSPLVPMQDTHICNQACSQWIRGMVLHVFIP